jgi:hypothetical protein
VKSLIFDLHPLYASILRDGAIIREGEVLGLDGDLRRVFAAPFTGTIRLLVTGSGEERRLRVFLNEMATPQRLSLRNSSQRGSVTFSAS